MVADIFDALRAKRPYRDSLPLEKVFEIMRADSPRALDLPCLEALIATKTGAATPVISAQIEQDQTTAQKVRITT